MEIKCNFRISSFDQCGDFYYCSVEAKIPDDEELKFIGEHKDGKTNDDVTYVNVPYYYTIAKVPQGITKTFPNLKILSISKLNELCKDDLAEYKNLEKIRFKCNEAECLLGDIFEGFKNLEYISLYESKFKVIEPNILFGHDKLKHIDLRGNQYSNMICSIYSSVENKMKPQELQSQIIVNFFSSDRKYVENFLNKFEDPVEELKKYEDLCLDAPTRHKISNLKFNILQQRSNNEIQELKNTNEALKEENSKLSSKFQSSISDDVKAFINEDCTKDFKIIIDNREFPVHKFLLAARSQTLAELLKNNPDAENLNLVDISVEIFEKILKFLYTDILPGDDVTNFMQLFAAAGKLKIQELKNYAALKIIETITSENSFEILSLSNKYEHKELRQKAFDEIKKKYTRIEFKDEWASKPESLLKIIEVYEKKLASVLKLEEDLKNMMLEDIKV